MIYSNQESTGNLMAVLNQTKASDFKSYEQKYLKNAKPYFPAYIDELLEQKNLKRQDVLLRADLPQKYGYKLLSGETHTTDRNKILRICFSMEMTLPETQRALKLYGMNELYPKVKRDALLILAIGEKMYEPEQVNDWLKQHKETPLY